MRTQIAEALLRIGTVAGIVFLMGNSLLLAQDQVNGKGKFLEQIDQIATSPLEILPTSDCKLHRLEEEIYLHYRQAGQEIPAEITYTLNAKSDQIQFRRSYIDSLYYIQALQAINQEKPDWNAAMNAIDKSLLHNRFFVRSVIFKTNYLLNIRQNAESCLRYVNTCLQELSSKEKVTEMATTVYKEMLDETQHLIDKNLFRDALDLCHLIKTYFQPGFNIRYIPYKEKQLVNEAHQGIYHSYFLVAQKAYLQGQYQLAQKYALQAYRYYIENEKYMGGINYVLDILDHIAVQYALYAEASGPEEKAFYRHQIDAIQEETGIVISNTSYYDAQIDIDKDLAWLNRNDSNKQKKAETTDKKEFQAKEADTTYLHLKKLSHSQANALFANAWEQAHHYASKREFEKAYDWFETARILQQNHRIQSQHKLTEAYSDNILKTVEQLLNKAVYHLWNSQTAQAETLYQKAVSLFEKYQDDYPGQASTMSRLQQILSVYQEKKNDAYCQQLAKDLDNARLGFYRQASFGNYQSAQSKADSYNVLYQNFNRPEYASCPPRQEEKDEISRILKAWNFYNQNLEKAEVLLSQSHDTLSYIQTMLEGEEVFDSLDLERFLPRPSSLFSQLTSSGQWRILCIWAQDCLDHQDEKQAGFILGYFSSVGYKTAETEKMDRQLRKMGERSLFKKSISRK